MHKINYKTLGKKYKVYRKMSQLQVFIFIKLQVIQQI